MAGRATRVETVIMAKVGAIRAGARVTRKSRVINERE